MKKTIFLILVLLPIVLVLTIAFSGRILSLYQHISVEKVEFVDQDGNPFGNANFTLNMGETKPTAIKIYPELASNKKVTYTSSNEEICTVDKDGNITGQFYGNASITVETEDGGWMAILNVRVTADYPVAVHIVSKNNHTLPLEELTLLVGEQYTVDVVVEMTAALDKYKRVTFSSGNPDILTVDPDTGRIVAVAPGETTVTVTSSYDTSLFDVLRVTVDAGQLPLEFDFSGVEEVILRDVNLYSLSALSLDLMANLMVRDDIDTNDIRFEISSGNKSASISQGVLSFNSDVSAFTTVKIRVYVASNPTYAIEIEVVYFPS